MTIKEYQSVVLADAETHLSKMNDEEVKTVNRQLEHLGQENISTTIRMKAIAVVDEVIKNVKSRQGDIQ